MNLSKKQIIFFIAISSFILGFKIGGSFFSYNKERENITKKECNKHSSRRRR